jgi:nitroimidazol reductase NimA-like FMN-containing flavoprotein (pyridoxamine 5'-phosphate oxidase superfamily)
MKNPDEPLFDSDVTRDTQPAASDPGVRDQIQRLVDGQRYAVLCVQGDGQPYGALVAFAFSADLRFATFATPMATRKYRLLSRCGRVALLIDSRSEMGAELMDIEAVTVTGHATRCEPGEEFDHWADLLVGRHPYLHAFVRAESTALFRVKVVRFLHVMRFQEVRQWVPTTSS